MNLVIDIGNTRIKSALFENKLLKKYFVSNNIHEFQNNSELINFFPLIKKIIISNVSDSEILIFLKEYFLSKQIFIASADLKLPFFIDYETPHTLGSDRIAAVAGAHAECKQDNILIIDFGTCIKYNILVNNTFVGGAISPGLQMRYKALHHYTGKLPLLNTEHADNVPNVIGKNSNNNIHSGIINGCIFEIKGFIENIKETYHDNFKIIFTGGDAVFFEKVLEIKVLLRPYLILTGLNELLEYQK